MTNNEDTETIESILFYDLKKPFGELSNFYKPPKKEGDFIFDDKKYQTTEHFYQCKKFDYAGASEVSHEYAEIIRLSKTPNIAFCYGNQVCNSPYPWAKPIREKIKEFENKVEMDPNWMENRDEIMYTAVLGKFTQNVRLRKLLLDTKERQIVEHTHRDDYWADGGDGSGENKLGKIIMKVRKELQQKSNLGKRKLNIVNNSQAKKIRKLNKK